MKRWIGFSEDDDKRTEGADIKLPKLANALRTTPSTFARASAQSYGARHQWNEPKPRKTSRNCERKFASTTACITRTQRRSSATANTTGSTRNLLISKHDFLISLRLIRQLSPLAANPWKRLRKSSTARRCLASTIPIPKKRSRIFTN